MTNDVGAVTAWGERVVGLLDTLQHAQRRLHDLAMSLPSGGEPLERLAALRSVWDKLGVVAPSNASIDERTALLGAILQREGPMVGQAAAGLLDGVLHEIARLLAAGAQDPTRWVLLAADFGNQTWATKVDVAGADVLMGAVAALPAGHVGRTILPEEELFTWNSRPVLVLGDRRKKWFELEAVRSLTQQWTSERRAAIEAKRKSDEAEEARRLNEYKSSPEGWSADVTRTVNELLASRNALREEVARLKVQQPAQPV